MPAAVMSTEAACVDIAINLDYLTSKVVLQDPGIERTDPHSLLEINCMDDEVHFVMPGGCDDYDNEADEMDESDVNLTASGQRQAATELERLDLGTSDVDGYEGDHFDDADTDEEEEASQADHGLTQTLKD
jgi:hypothetical protein